MERVSIFIDGGNFYYLVLKKLAVTEGSFDFHAFALFLTGSRHIVSRRYYVGTVRERQGDEKSRLRVASQVRYLALLRNAGWETKTSRLRRRIEEVVIDQRVEDYQKLQSMGIRSIKFERMREKGIDVKLATDIMMGAVDDQYDTAILISSDADLIPAIDWVRGRFKKKVEYVGFSFPNDSNPETATRPLLSLIARSDVQRILTKQDLLSFVRDKRVDFNAVF